MALLGLWLEGCTINSRLPCPDLNTFEENVRQGKVELTFRELALGRHQYQDISFRDVEPLPNAAASFPSKSFRPSSRGLPSVAMDVLFIAMEEDRDTT